jgi:hypothetical protein
VKNDSNIKNESGAALAGFIPELATSEVQSVEASIILAAQVALTSAAWTTERATQLVAQCRSRRLTPDELAAARELLGRLKIAKSDLEKFL